MKGKEGVTGGRPRVGRVEARGSWRGVQLSERMRQAGRQGVIDPVREWSHGGKGGRSQGGARETGKEEM